mgnify:CR=1 FL=1
MLVMRSLKPEVVGEEVLHPPFSQLVIVQPVCSLRCCTLGPMAAKHSATLETAASLEIGFHTIIIFFLLRVSFAIFVCGFVFLPNLSS